ncbi:MAG: 1-deoxy-D-xylulose-5-phosphate synthase [Candidatus Omnitrophica bacterium]|nr:1-deoxy-D-xylulose-5-phosphate synthase [Candidatus Omnitrophota bacterium]
MEPLLPHINSPIDLRKLPKEELPRVAREVRDCIIETVSEKGGHLGAGLGVTDLTVALHYLLDTPNDFLVWDVGHQVQAHKILTGRRDAFRQSFRQHKGVSGLVNAGESPYDVFTTGHGGPSISAALGVAAARRRMGHNTKVVAVIGDTSIANGMALEAMNHAGHIRENLVVILNDNEMSISKSVGAMSRYLNQVITNPTYNHLREEVEGLIGRMPKVGGRVLGKIKYIEEGVKHLLVPGQLFENFGFRYFGPLDGHNFDTMLDLFPKIFSIQGPVLVHVLTKKGKGMPMAEADPIRWHASAPFDMKTGELKKKSTELSYTEVFGQTLCELAEKDTRIAALTGGMPEGTGLVKFGQKFPERLFDVGISEEHGVTFCAGLAYGKMRPFAAIYSTFMQRAFDQIVHDIALQNLPVIFAMDRGGLVGEDGPTHHGVLDISFMRKIPGMTVLAPRDGKEFVQMIRFAVDHTSGPIALRYPRGSVTELAYPLLSQHPATPIEYGKSELLKEGSDVMLVAYGAMTGPALDAAVLLEKEGVSAGVINARFAKPLDEELIVSWAQRVRSVITIEEGCVAGGFGSAVLEALSARQITTPVRCLGIPDQFIEHGPRNVLLDFCGLSPQKITSSALETLKGLGSSVLPSPTTR